MENLIDKLTALGGKIAQQRHLHAISSGLMALMPLTIFGSIFQLIAALPDILPFLPAWSDAMKAAILAPYNIAFGLFGLIALVAITYYHARQYGLDILQTEIVAVISFAVLGAPLDTETNVLDASFLGSQGVFLAIIVALVVVELWKLYADHGPQIKLPDSIPPYVAGSFNAIIPMFLIVLASYLVSTAVQGATGMLLPAAIMGMLAPALTASESVGFCCLIAFLIALLQCFGIHGFNVLAGLFLPLMIANTGANAEAFGAGLAAEHIFTLPMFQMSGVFMWIIPAMFLLHGKSEKLRQIGKIGIVPAIFNIAEPIQFSVITLNPLLAVPWIIMYTVNMAIVYLSMSLGFCNKAVIMASSNIPFPIFSYLCTLDFRAVIVFVVMLVFSYFLWLPFVKAYDKQCLAEEGASEE